MSTMDTALISTGCPAAGLQISVMDGKPFGVPFTIDVAAVALVDEVAELVDQNVVQVEILGGLFAPGERPDTGRRLGPATAVHFRLVYQIRPRRGVVRFDKRLFDRVKVEGVAPLHAVARERLL